MKLTINNFRRIQAARLELAPIALLLGHNEQGKTSVSQALGAVLVRSPGVIEGMLKKDMSEIINDSAQIATVDLEGEDWSVSMSWPKGDVVTRGAAPTATNIATGRQRLSRMKVEDAAQTLFSVLKVIPTEEMIISEFKQTARNHRVVLSDAHIREALDKLKAGGWDGAAKWADSEATAFKRDWKNTTGQVWGSTKGADWRPDGFEPDLLDLNEGALKERLTECTTAYEESIGDQALGEADVKALKEKAAKLPELEELKKIKGKTLASYDPLIETTKKQLAEMRSGPQPVVCPECNSSLVATINGNDVQLAPHVGEYHVVPEKLIKEKQSSLEAQITGKNNLLVEIGKIDQQISEATAAKKKVSSTTKKAAASKEERDEAQKHLENSKARLVRFQTYHKAKVTHDMIMVYSMLGAEFAPDGIRRRRLTEQLANVLNPKLADVSAVLDIRPVTINSDMEIFCGTRKYTYLSTAAQFLADVAIQLAMAQLDGSGAVVIDGADVIQFPERRKRLLLAVKAAGLPALITMSAKDITSAPDLEKAGLGNTYWIEAGEINE